MDLPESTQWDDALDVELAGSQRRRPHSEDAKGVGQNQSEQVANDANDDDDDDDDDDGLAQLAELMILSSEVQAAEAVAGANVDENLDHLSDYAPSHAGDLQLDPDQAASQDVSDIGVSASSWDDVISDSIASAPSEAAHDRPGHGVGAERGRGRGRGRAAGGRKSGSRILRQSIQAFQEAHNREQSENAELVPRVPSVVTALAARSAKAQRIREQTLDPQQFGPSAIICHTGSPVQRTLASALQLLVKTPDDWKATLASINSVDKLEPLDLVLSGAGLLCSAQALANITSSSKTTVQRRLIQAGSATMESTGFLIGSMLSLLEKQADHIEPFIFILSVKYDETPTRVRVATLPMQDDEMDRGSGCQHVIVPKSCAKGPELQRFLAAQGQKRSADASMAAQATNHAKLLQTQVEVISVYKVKCLGQSQVPEFRSIQTALPCGLQAMDRSTGENQRRAVWETITVIPELTRIMESFPIQIRLAATDRYTANFRTERGLSEYMQGAWLCHLPCDAHKASTCIKHCLRPCESDVSGILNTGLMLGGDLGVVKKLRDLFIAVLCQDLNVCASPPENHAECERFRTEVFNLFLPTVGVPPGEAKLNQKRRFVLKFFFNCDLSSQVVEHYCQGCCHGPDERLMAMSQYLAWSLIPFKCPVFSRKNWINQPPAMHLGHSYKSFLVCFKSFRFQGSGNFDM